MHIDIIIVCIVCQLLGQASSMLVSSAAVQGNCPGHLQETIVETFREILQQTVLSNRIF